MYIYIHTQSPCLILCRSSHILPTCINSSWPSIILLPVACLSFLGPLLIGTDHCRSCNFANALTQLSSCSNSDAFPFLLLLTLQDKMFTCCQIYPIHCQVPHLRLSPTIIRQFNLLP